ncbi:uracil-DNA glycosylase-like protein [Suillus plorans]|uniref:Uracil-DNA glycosylase n=1 Tax=Suillus plorans TaxID=116603 RepID=A0A9P7AL21_9AGAM|nr:uracil-DNA glycosylase-like protein [Suillus plorans]KAG1791722.1 uracil-DNA glycosylase-like protein [Suillus plorans]
MSDEQRVVYLEDVDTAVVSTSDAEKASESPSSKSQDGPAKATVTATQATGTLKRQRTLMDMLSGTQDCKSAKPAAKKLKLGASSSGPDSAKITVAGVQRLNAIPFSLSQYVESIPQDQKHLLKLESECMGKSWLKLLKEEIKKPYFISLKKFLWEEGVHGPDESAKNLKVYPSPKDIYAWSNTPLGKVKVVIIGQDPYHGPNQAHGLCFSVPKGVTVPPSLKNIYAEIKAEYPEFEPPKHGNLTAWADNGVLMLNTCLTVKANKAGSHSGKGWEEFTDKVVDVVDKYGGANLSSGGDSDMNGIGRGVVFLAWGSWAAKRVAKLSKTKHLILTSAHPSPFSAHKGFLGNGHFKAANGWLEKKYGPQGKVDWCNLD